jgi:hypothetical protein
MVGSLEACLLAQRGMEVGSCGAEPVGSLEPSISAEQVMDEGGGGGRTGELSGSMSTGTARNGGRVSGLRA